MIVCQEHKQLFLARVILVHLQGDHLAFAVNLAQKLTRKPRLNWMRKDRKHLKKKRMNSCWALKE